MNFSFQLVWQGHASQSFHLRNEILRLIPSRRERENVFKKQLETKEIYIRPLIPFHLFLLSKKSVRYAGLVAIEYIKIFASGKQIIPAILFFVLQPLTWSTAYNSSMFSLIFSVVFSWRFVMESGNKIKTRISRPNLFLYKNDQS